MTSWFKLFEAFQRDEDPELIERYEVECRNCITDLRDKLMLYEAQLQDQMGDLIKEFEENMQELVRNLIELAEVRILFTKMCAQVLLTVNIFFLTLLFSGKRSGLQ